jgi:hypothetical protein
MTPTLRLILTDEFGDQTDITKTLTGSSMDQIYVAIREALAGCGYSLVTIDEFFPEV